MVRRAVLSILRFYQKHVSPLFPGTCRFRPTCSEYTIQAVRKYGVLRGGYFSLRRILKCHPLGATGYDPVP